VVGIARARYRPRVRQVVERLETGDALVAGVLCGTSGDGIDVVLARCAARAGRLRSVEPLAFETRPFRPELAPRVRAALDGQPLDARATALLSRDLGLAFGRAVRELAAQHDLALDLVGSHGLTVWHHDGTDPAGRATLQLGDGDFVAEAAGCAAVSDFRQRDLAAGGEGAPLSALADDLLFAREPRPLSVLNLGGMANLTWLGRDGEETLAFDTGPAGSLLDGLARRLFDAPCDRDGASALSGVAVPELVAELARHPFLARRPPKSTGRDTFGEAWVEGVLARARRRLDARPEDDPRAAARDLMATAVEFVAAAVERGVREHLPAPPARLLVAGGGVHNRALMAALERRLACPVVSSAAAGVDPDAREALVFAVLAARCALGEPSTRPAATGAAPGRAPGKISPPAR